MIGETNLLDRKIGISQCATVAFISRQFGVIRTEIPRKYDLSHARSQFSQVSGIGQLTRLKNRMCPMTAFFT